MSCIYIYIFHSQESKDNLAGANSKLVDLEKERDFLMKQLNNTMPAVSIKLLILFNDKQYTTKQF